MRSFSAVIGKLSGWMNALAGIVLFLKKTWDRGHVCADFLVENRSADVKNAIFIITRVVSMALFAFFSYYLLLNRRAKQCYSNDWLVRENEELRAENSILLRLLTGAEATIDYWRDGYITLMKREILMGGLYSYEA